MHGSYKRKYDYKIDFTFSIENSNNNKKQKI